MEQCTYVLMIVRVGELQSCFQGAQHVIHGDAEYRLYRRTQVDHLHRLVDHGDDIRIVLHKGAEARLALTERRLGFLARADILNLSDDGPDGAAFVLDGGGIEEPPDDATIFAHEP